LLNLLKSEAWVEAERVLKEATTVHYSEQQYSELRRSSAFEAFESMITAADSSGQIPLHIAIWKQAPDALIVQLIDACEVRVASQIAFI